MTEDFWGIREKRHGRFSGQLQVEHKKLNTGTYAMKLEAAKALDMLIYKTNNPKALQVGLSNEEKQWLDTHSLEDLQLEFKRASIKPGQGGSSAFRGVCKRDGRFEATVQKRVAGRNVVLFRQLFDSEEDAARAYDHAALQHRGRDTLINFSYSEAELAEIKPGSKQSNALQLTAATNATVCAKQRQNRPRKAVLAEASDVDGGASDSDEEEDASFDVTSESEGDDLDEISNDDFAAKDNVGKNQASRGQSSRRGTARAGAAKHKSLNVDTMLGQVSGDDDTDAARDGDASDCEDNALPCGIDPQADISSGAPNVKAHDVKRVSDIMKIHHGSADQDDHVRDLLTRRIPQTLQAARDGNLSFAAAYWGVPPAPVKPADKAAAASELLHAADKPPKGPGNSARISAPMPQVSLAEETRAQMNEILRLVAEGHTAEEIADPALNPFLRPLVRGKLAPSAAVSTPGRSLRPHGTSSSANINVTTDGGLSVGIVPTAKEIRAGDRNVGTDSTPPAAKDGVNTAQHGGTIPIDFSKAVPGVASKPVTDQPPTAGIQTAAAATCERFSQPVDTGVNQAVGQDGAPADASKAKLWTRSRGKWLKTGRKRTGFAVNLEPPAAEAPPDSAPKHSSVLLAEKFKAAVIAATDAMPARLPPDAQGEESCRMKAAPFNMDDWLGPYRGHIKMMVAAGPAGRAQLLAAGFPPEEIPASPLRMTADAHREDVPYMQYPPHLMRMIFEGLLSGWDSPQYAETHHLPTRAAQALYRYQLWPQDKPEDWTFEKAKQEEADEDRALAVSIREEILYMRAIVDDLKARRARGEPIRWELDPDS